MLAGATISLDDVTGWLPAPQPHDNKYSRGVVGLAVGSSDFPGAAVLATEAAVHSGVGMVRLSTDPSVEQLVLQARPEAVVSPGAVDAIVVGSGLTDGSAEEIRRRLDLFSATPHTPLVIDAGALSEASWMEGPKLLTPHAGEMKRLAEWNHLPGDEPLAWAEALAATWGVVVYLKGHQSVVCAPEGVVYRLPVATPWLATAGTGDVLAGVMGAVLAMKKQPHWSTSDLALAAATAGLIHREAAQRLSRESGAGRPGPIVARDLARALSPVVAALVGDSEPSQA